MSRWDGELATLVAKRGRALIGYAYALCGDFPQAEDLVQDALVKTFAKPRSLRATNPEAIIVPLHEDGAEIPPTIGTEAYVRRAILTLYLDTYRRSARWRQRRHLVAEAGIVRSPETAATASADVAAALANLTPQERAAIVLRHYEDLTISEIALAMNLAEGTVKRYLSDAQATLRDVLAEHRFRLAPPPPAVDITPQYPALKEAVQ
ncbi:MAG: sigma-70 family RNA polymerase sigma factor [Promicromonosporaceae bacterium]|nr:sigma-70 family RNA polymerase sigma factor [Promicromonosporaceae bacterium]